MAIPPTFKSHYRLFLRALSASVLHHPTAAQNLRRLYRASFAQATHLFEKRDSYALQLWDRRVDTTLSLLYSAATTHGIPHKLLRNISLLAHSYNIHHQTQSKKVKPWTSIKFGVPKGSPSHQESNSRQIVEQSAWGALGEVVKLAEGHTGLILGRLNFRGRDGVRKTKRRR